MNNRRMRVDSLARQLKYFARCFIPDTEYTSSDEYPLSGSPLGDFNSLLNELLQLATDGCECHPSERVGDECVGPYKAPTLKEAIVLCNQIASAMPPPDHAPGCQGGRAGHETDRLNRLMNHIASGEDVALSTKEGRGPLERCIERAVSSSGNETYWIVRALMVLAIQKQDKPGLGDS